MKMTQFSVDLNKNIKSKQMGKDPIYTSLIISSMNIVIDNIKH